MAKAPVRKAAPAKKPVAKKAEAAVNGNLTRTEESMSIRKIKNGYVVRRSWSEGTGLKAKYKEEEIFTPKKPVINI